MLAANPKNYCFTKKIQLLIKYNFHLIFKLVFLRQKNVSYIE